MRLVLLVLLLVRYGICPAPLPLPIHITAAARYPSLLLRLMCVVHMIFTPRTRRNLQA
jgi:hypothetical protein